MYADRNLEAACAAKGYSAGALAAPEDFRPIENRIVNIISALSRIDSGLRDILARAGGERDASPAPSAQVQPIHGNDLNSISSVASEAATGVEEIVERIARYI